VSFVVAGASDPFFITQRCGAVAAAKKFNVNLSFQGPTAPDYQQELNTFNSELVKQPDAMVVVPFNPTAFLAPVRNAVAKGIPVVLNNGTLSQDNVGTRQYVTDEVQLGRLAAQGLAKQIGEQGEVAILAFRSDVPPIQKRIAGFRAGLKAFPSIKLVSLQYSDDEAAKAASQVGGMLQAHPQLKAIFATDTTNTQSAASALKGNGKSGVVKLVGYDASPQEIQALKDGTVQALVAQNPYEYGFRTLKYAAEAARKQVQPSSAGFTQMIGGKFITKATAGNADVQPFIYRSSC
jgi:ribose transport system substrate-binding protein